MIYGNSRVYIGLGLEHFLMRKCAVGFKMLTSRPKTIPRVMYGLYIILYNYTVISEVEFNTNRNRGNLNARGLLRKLSVIVNIVHKYQLWHEILMLETVEMIKNQNGNLAEN